MRDLLRFLVEHRGLSHRRLRSKSARRNWKGQLTQVSCTDEESRRYEAELYLHRNAGIRRDLLSLQIRCLDLEPGTPGWLIYQRYQIDGCSLIPDSDLSEAPIHIPSKLLPE